MSVDLSAAFLEDILEHPEEDRYRLVYADWLEDRGQGEWAEFIRVQIALAAWPCECDEVEQVYYDECRCKEKGELQRCERELFSHGCMLFHSETPFGTRCVLTLDANTTSSLPVLRFRRGFVEHIALPCAAFMKHAGALFRAQPIQSVELVDREPNLRRVPCGWTWVRDGNWRETSVVRECLPWSLYELIQGGRPGRAAESPEDARRWLSAACIRYGRKRAGLTG